MAGWHSLPPEIHNHILDLLCKDIIATYTALGSNLERDARRWVQETGLRLPDAPQCLQHISWATKVCRFIYYSIVHDIKINGVSAMEYLQVLQCNRVRAIALYSLRPKDREMAKHHRQVHVGLFMTLAGIFWKNEKVLEDPATIYPVLRVLQKFSLMMLLPHLKEWVHRHASDGYDGYSCLDLGGGHECVMRIGGEGSLALEGDATGDVFMDTTDGLYQGFEQEKENDWEGGPIGPDEYYRERQEIANRSHRAKYRIIQAIEASKPHTWWLFHLYHGSVSEYFLVNFEERAFWHNILGTGLYLRYHEEDVRNPKMWEVVRAGADKGECFPKVGEWLVDIGVNDEDSGGYEESRRNWCTGSHVDADGGSESDTALEGNDLAPRVVYDLGYNVDDDLSDFIFEALRESCERRSSIDL